MTAKDTELLDYRTTENLWIPTTPISDASGSLTGSDLLDVGDTTEGDSSSDDGELEEFLLDAFCDSKPSEEQAADVLQVGI